MTNNNDTSKPGLWSRLWRRPKRRWLLGIPAGGFLMLFVGAAGLGTTNYVLHETSTTEFCFSCHSHELNLREEFNASTHTNNAAGVRAECSDCHLPEMHGNWFRYVTTKIIVSADIFDELAGTVSTKEKWEENRGRMARHVWEEYRENKSEYCLHCHTPEHMVLEEQERRAQRKHADMESAEGGCIDCHQGVVHALPENWREIWDEVVADGPEKAAERMPADIPESATVAGPVSAWRAISLTIL